MNLNDEQKRAVRYDGNACISACPGSGKTRTIVAKMLRCVDDVRGTSRKVACITYTHAAVDEIEKRLREFENSEDHDYFEICTIHSFCLNNILRPFYYRLPELSSGFDIFPPDSSDWRAFVQELASRHEIDRRRLDYFTGVQREPDGTLFIPKGIPRDAAVDFVEHMDRNGLVTFADVVFHSYRILQCDAFVARGLASRFAWMLIDEFQDTTASQVAILRAIAQHKQTKFFMVGDPNQSIMSFAGAHPDLMQEFPEEIYAKTDMSLSGNYRCSQKIVCWAETLLATHPPMQAVGEWKNFEHDPEYVHVDSCTAGIFEYFLPTLDSLGIPLGEAAVLAPWWTTLYRLARELKKMDVPVLGPGARPYRRSNLFAGLAEHLCAYVEWQDNDLFRATQRSLFIMLLNITGMADWRVYSYDGRRCLCMILSSVRELRNIEDSAVDWLRSAAEIVETILLEEEFIMPSASNMIGESAEGMIHNMVTNKIDIDNLHVDDLALYARPKDCLNLLTMHGSKGKEFDAIAIVDLHDGRVPDFRACNEDEIREDRRQLYVAMTRPRKVLMCFTDRSNDRNQPSRFLYEMGVVS